MSTTGWIILAAALAVLLGLWVYRTASRLDRLHARLDAAQSALDAQLVRRVAALRHAADLVVDLDLGGADGADPASQLPAILPPERDRIEAITQVALATVGPDRQVAENEVGRAVAEMAAGHVRLSTAQRAELHESAVRVSIARRFYNDAVRDTRALRGRRMPRLLHLAGRREMPQFFDIDDTIPQELDKI
jgi:hypothetical protein